MSIGLCCQYLKSKEKRNGTIEYFNAMEEKIFNLADSTMVNIQKNKL